MKRLRKGNGSLVHDRLGQMMWPRRGVIVGPEAGVDLGNDDLLVFWANIIDFFAEQRGGVDAVCTNSTSQRLSRGIIW